MNITDIKIGSKVYRNKVYIPSFGIHICALTANITKKTTNELNVKSNLNNKFNITSTHLKYFQAKLFLYTKKW